MRTIKSRAWNKKEKCFAVSNLHLELSGELLSMNYSQYDGYETNVTNNYIIEQFIGLQDNSGKDIYKGDIVRWDDRSNGKYWRIAVVKLNPDIQFDCSEIKIQDNAQCDYCFRFGNFIYKDTHNYLEIIGNIHENQELLK